jgi:hypothetical protein
MISPFSSAIVIAESPHETPKRKALFLIEHKITQIIHTKKHSTKKIYKKRHFTAPKNPSPRTGRRLTGQKAQLRETVSEADVSMSDFGFSKSDFVPPVSCFVPTYEYFVSGRSKIVARSPLFHQKTVPLQKRKFILIKFLYYV